MKHIIYISLFLVLLNIGCSDNQPITSPEFGPEFEKTNNPSNPSDLNCEEAQIILDEDVQPEWIPLPLPNLSGGPGPDYFIKSEMVYRNQRKTLNIVYTYATENQDSVKLTATLKFDDHSLYEDSLLITMKIDTRNGTLVFEPHTQFDRHVHLNYLIEGLDVSEINPNEIDFIFGGASGIIEYINYDNLTIDDQNNSIYMHRAHLTHFSRFGFIK